MEGVIGFASDLFDLATAERLAARLVRVLEAVAADPEMRVGQVDLLSAAERRQLLRGVERHRRRRSRPRRCRGLFEAQAAATPSAVAVTGGERR